MSNLSRRHTGDTQKAGGVICRLCTSLQQNGSEYKQNHFVSVAVIFLPAINMSNIIFFWKKDDLLRFLQNQ